MHQMTSLEYSFLVNELAPKLAGKHFGRIRKLADGIYRMKIGTMELLCGLGVRMHETKYIEKTDETDHFAEKAAKELDNAKLISVEQLNSDRIVAFNFDKGSIIFEMFGEGNAVLARGGKTICAVHYGKWSDREITAGEPYSPPKNVPSAKLELTQKYVIVSLTKLPLGKDYALEALARAGIDEKKPGNELSPAESRRLESEISKIRELASPFAFYSSGKPVDFALAPLTKHSGLEAKSFPTLSEAADEYYQNAERPNPKLEKLMGRLEKQKERLTELSEEEKEAKARGDYIYANYQEVERILALAKAGKFEEIEKQYAGKTDKKEKSIEAEF